MVANWTNITRFDQLPALANSTTNGTYWTGILFMLYVVAIISMMGWGFGTALLVASTIGLVVSMLMYYAGLVGSWVVSMFLASLLLTIIYVIYSRRNQD